MNNIIYKKLKPLLKYLIPIFIITNFSAYFINRMLDWSINLSNWHTYTIIKIILTSVAYFSTLILFCFIFFRTIFKYATFGIIVFCVLIFISGIYFVSGFEIVTDLSSGPKKYSGSCYVKQIHEGRGGFVPHIIFTDNQIHRIRLYIEDYLALGGGNETNVDYKCTKNIKAYYLNSADYLLSIEY